MGEKVCASDYHDEQVLILADCGWLIRWGVALPELMISPPYPRPPSLGRAIAPVAIRALLGPRRHPLSRGLIQWAPNGL